MKLPTIVGVAGALLLLATPGSAASSRLDRLQSIAAQQGTVRVLAQLAVPAGRDSMRGAQAPVELAMQRLSADLSGTSWKIQRQFHTIPYVALEVSPAALQALTASAMVTGIEEDRLERVALRESVPLTQADVAWADGYDGTGWTIAILDTGVAKAHPFLDGKVVSEACYSALGDCPNGQSEQLGVGAGEPCSYAASSCAHGTHVAGIAAGRGDEFSGIGRGASVISIQVFSRFTGSDCDDDVEDPCAKTYTSDSIAALERVYDLRTTYRIAAVNMSFGGGGFASQVVCDLIDAARKAMIDQLRAVGIATVAAAGNAASTDSLLAPACISSAISVGATTKDDQIVGFSNSAPFLSLLAPGRFILSSVPPDRFVEISGTSMAAPHVSGAFAILSARLGRADVATSLAALQHTGKPIEDPRNGIVTARIAIADALPALFRCHGRFATLAGTAGPDRLEGTSGPDVIVGLGGNDCIFGGNGDDILCGGGGDDVLRGGKGEDVLVGGSGDDRLFGGDDGDLLIGGPGDDKLRGEGGADVLRGDSGVDRCLGGAEGDVGRPSCDTTVDIP